MNTMNATPAETPPGVPVVVRWVLMGLCLLLLAVFAIRYSGQDIRQPDAPMVWKKSLRFADGARGEIVVVDANTDQQVAVFEGEQGFLRSSLRALVRERHREHLGSDAPFLLIGRTDGRLTLIDPSTQQRIDLESFGPSNAAVFAGLRLAGTDHAPLKSAR